MHNSAWSKSKVRNAQRKFRYAAKSELKKGNDPPKTYAVGYTD